MRLLFVTFTWTHCSILFPFTLNGIWSWWQFSFRFLFKWNSIWFKIERKTVTTIRFHSIYRKWNTSFLSERDAHIGECFLCVAANKTVYFMREKFKSTANEEITCKDFIIVRQLFGFTVDNWIHCKLSNCKVKIWIYFGQID